ncbi:MAG: porin [Pseudomonadota bacterium]
MKRFIGGDRRAAALAAMLATAGVAQAQAQTQLQEQAAPPTDAGPTWTFGGFGTLGVAHANLRDGDYVIKVLKKSGVGHSGAWSADVDSRLGAQLDLKVDTRWSAVVQLVSEQGYNGSYRPVIEWANIKYRVSPELSVRIGRIALPIYLAADYSKVGYANPWLRTPVEVYGTLQISNSDGIDGTYRWTAGGLKHATQGFFGGTNVDLPLDARAGARRLRGFSHTIDRGAFSARGSYLAGDVSVDLVHPLFQAFRQFGPPGNALADRYDFDHKRMTAWSVGANYDPGDWFLTGEFSTLKVRSFLGHSNGFYVSGGYRFGNWTPYATFSHTKSDSANVEPGLPLYGSPAQIGAARALNGALGDLLRSVATQETASAGMRWDFRRNMALKVQYDRVRPHGNSTGTLINVQPEYRSGRSVNVISATLDFVY